MSDIVKIKNGEISYNRDLLIKQLRKAGEKSLGGYSIDDALENAFLEGIEAAFRAVYTIFDDDQEEEENEKSVCIF